MKCVVPATCRDTNTDCYSTARWRVTGTHGAIKKTAYLALKLITQEMKLIPSKSLDDCELIGVVRMKNSKLIKLFEGYKYLPSQLQTKRFTHTKDLPLERGVRLFQWQR